MYVVEENEGEERGARRGCVEVEEDVSRIEVDVDVEVGSSASRVVVLEVEVSLRL